MAAIISTNLYADGFLCEAVSDSLKINVFNKTHPEYGTRNPSTMVVFDGEVSKPNKTIAIFKAPKTLKTLKGQSGVRAYVGKVDLRYSNSSRKGENILGTKLGMLKGIVLKVNFNYSNPVTAGSLMHGTVEAYKRNGRKITEEVSCERYLKNK